MQTQLWTINSLSTQLKIDRRTLAKRLEGLPPAKVTRRNDESEIRYWNLADVVAHLQDPGKREPGEDFDPDDLRPKERLDWYRAESEKRKLEETNRELIPAAEIEQQFSAYVTVVVMFLDTLPDILERDAGIDGLAVERVQAQVDKLRTELHAKLEEQFS